MNVRQHDDLSRFALETLSRSFIKPPKSFPIRPVII